MGGVGAAFRKPANKNARRMPVCSWRGTNGARLRIFASAIK
jgi:hypothetical protein